MKNSATTLREIGFDEWFLEAVPRQHLEQFDLTRVVAVHKDKFTLSNGEIESQAELLGKIIYSASSPLDYPAVCDWVLASFFAENTISIIHQVLPRKTLLKRKTPWEES